MKKALKNESGAVFVEASFVFPIMVFVILIMILIGNAVYIKARIDAIVVNAAIEGAAYCADPQLENIEKNGIPITTKGLDIKPYANLFGHKDIESAVKTDVKEKINEVGSGLFSGMEPVCEEPVVDFHNYLVCSSFEVSVKYSVKLPMTIPGEEALQANWQSKSVKPVNDTTNFIRDVDMVKDYMDRFGVTDWIKEKFKPVSEFFSKLKGGTD